MTKWVCTSCDYEAEGVNPPKKCPKCGAGKDSFEIMDEKEFNEKGEEVENDDEEWEEEIEYGDDSD